MPKNLNTVLVTEWTKAPRNANGQWVRLSPHSFTNPSEWLFLASNQRCAGQGRIISRVETNIILVYLYAVARETRPNKAGGRAHLRGATPTRVHHFVCGLPPARRSAPGQRRAARSSLVAGKGQAGPGYGRVWSPVPAKSGAHPR